MVELGGLSEVFGSKELGNLGRGEEVMLEFGWKRPMTAPGHAGRDLIVSAYPLTPADLQCTDSTSSRTCFSRLISAIRPTFSGGPACAGPCSGNFYVLMCIVLDYL